MPDVQEVFRMSTQKVKPDPGALERQHTRQRRRSIGTKAGSLAVAAAIALTVVAVVVATQTGGTTTTPVGDPPPPPLDLPSPRTPADGIAEEAARGFLEAYGAFDAERAMSFVAADADLRGLIEPQVPADAEGLSMQLALLEAQGYEQTVTSCDPYRIGTDTRLTGVTCEIDFHGIRSDEIGRGPFSGTDFSFVVQDGEIIQASMSWGIVEFSPQMWEPFAEWVATEHPKDVKVMYVDASQANYRLTEESIRLWERRSKDYVKAVQSGNAA